MKNIKIGHFCIIIFIGIAITCVFSIPYLFPPNQISISASYDYGFNNRIGIIILAVFSLIILAASFVLISPDKIETDIFSDSSKKVVLDKCFFIGVVFTIIGICILRFIFGKDSYGIGESVYFIPRIQDISFGKTIYKDFDFILGPIFLYFPYFIYNILSFLSCSISDGYIIALFIFQLTGLYFLFYILSHLNFTRKEKDNIFIITTILSFPLTFGVQYTLFRFTLPFFCFVVLREYENSTRFKPLIYIIYLTILSIVTLLSSPEFGIAFYVSFLVYLGVTKVSSSKKIYYYLQAGILVFSFLLVVYFLPGMFEQFASYISGGNNWPFVPSLSLIVFFIAVFIVASIIGIQLHHISINSFTLTFILLSFSFIPAALGRCDPGHIFYNGMFIFILAYFHISKNYYRLKTIFVIFCVLSFLSPYPYFITNIVPYYGYQIMKNMDKLDDLPPWVITTAKWFGFDPERTMARAKTRKQMNYDELFANVNSISTPFGFDQNMYRYLKESKKLVPLYYTSIGYSGSVNGVDRNLIDLKEKEPKYLLLPQDWGKINLLSDYRDMINILFCTYYPALQKRNGNVIYDPLIEYIRANYEFDKDIETYALYKKK